jgi:hypothetical protein
MRLRGATSGATRNLQKWAVQVRHNALPRQVLVYQAVIGIFVVEIAEPVQVLLPPIRYGLANHATQMRNTAEIDETPVAEQGPFDFRDFVEVS